MLIHALEVTELKKGWERYLLVNSGLCLHRRFLNTIKLYWLQQSYQISIGHVFWIEYIWKNKRGNQCNDGIQIQLPYLELHEWKQTKSKLAIGQVHAIYNALHLQKPKNKRKKKIVIISYDNEFRFWSVDKFNNYACTYYFLNL